MATENPILHRVAYLRDKLAKKRPRILERYSYYEMKHRPRDFGISTPPNLRSFYSNLGWCTKAVDTLSDRVIYDGFYNDALGFAEVFGANNPSVMTEASKLSSQICGCSFAMILPGESVGANPTIQIFDGADATGIIDETTGLLREGYAVLERDDNERVLREAYFTTGSTYILVTGEKDITEISTPYMPCPLLVPVINRPDARRPFGHSRITRACMSIVDSAMRCAFRSEVSAEFYAFPQKWVTGTSQDMEIADKWRASMSAMIQLSKDDDGDHPIVGQFAQQSMTPHSEQLKMFASAFAGETGLTLDDLGFVTSNPSSAEAIKASHESLRLMAEKLQRDLSVAFVNIGYVAVCVRDQIAYDRSLIADVSTRWLPIFRPDSGALSAIGDGAIKINQAIPGYFDSETLRVITGINPAQDDGGTAQIIADYGEAEIMDGE